MVKHRLDAMWTDGAEAADVPENAKETIDPGGGIVEIYCPPIERKGTMVNTREGELAFALDESRMFMNPSRESEVRLVQRAQERGQNFCTICNEWFDSGSGSCTHPGLEFIFAHEEPSRS